MTSTETFYDQLRIRSESLQNELINSDLLKSCSMSVNDINYTKNKDVALQLRKYYASLAYEIKGKSNTFLNHEPQVNIVKQQDIPEISIETIKNCVPDNLLFLLISVIPYHFNYFLTATHTEQYFNILKQLSPEQIKDAILPLLYSPFSINFFRQSFHEALTPYFTYPSTALNCSEIVNIVIKKMDENMHLCPRSLIEFFIRDDFKQISGEILKDKILANFFAPNPSPLFSLFNQNSQVHSIGELFDKLIQSEDLITALQKGILANIFSESKKQKIQFNYLNDSYTFKMAYDSTILKPGSIPNSYTLYLLDNKHYKSLFAYDISQSKLENDLFKLLRISPRLPAKLPNYLKAKSPHEIIQALVLRDGPQYYLRMTLYNKIKNKTNEEIISELNNDDKTIGGQETELRTITEYTATLSKISEYTSNVYDHFHYDVFYDQNKNYIQKLVNKTDFTSPQSFTNEFLSNIQYYKDIPAFYNAYARPMTLSTFNANRLSLNSNDSAFCSSMKLNPFDPMKLISKELDEQSKKATINVINEIRRIITSGMTNFGQLFKHASNFISAFTEDNNPFEKCKCIIKQFNNLKNSIEMRVDSNTQKWINCNEKLFTLIIFETICPPNFVSVYVFLHDYLGRPILHALYGYPGFEYVAKTKGMLNNIISCKLDMNFHVLTLCKLSPQKAIPQIKVKPTDQHISLVSLYMVNDYMMFSASSKEVQNQQQLFVEKLTQLTKTQQSITIKILDKESLEIYSLEIVLSKDGTAELPQSRRTLLNFIKKPK